MADHVAVHRAAGRGSAEQHPFGADHGAWTGPAEATVRDRYLAAFGRALPGLSEEELWFRVRGVFAVTAVDRVEVYNQRLPAAASPAAGEAARRWAITFLAAAMSAPPTAT